MPLIAHALDTGGIAGAEQLQHEVQVRVPAVARQRRAQRDEARRTRPAIANPMISAAPMCSAASCAASGARSRPRLRRVADLDDAQVLEPIAQIREPLERLAAQRLWD